MRLHFVAIPVLGEPVAEAELNSFLASHRVLSVDRHLVDCGAASVWAICVSYVDADSGALRKRPGRTDYRELLPESEFAVFARLRALRKNVRAATRNDNASDNRNDNLGFRLARAQERALALAPDPMFIATCRLSLWGKRKGVPACQ